MEQRPNQYILSLSIISSHNFHICILFVNAIPTIKETRIDKNHVVNLRHDFSFFIEKMIAG